MKNAYKSGQDAFYAGADISDNPFPINSISAREWQKGFLAAQSALEEMFYSNDDKE